MKQNDNEPRIRAIIVDDESLARTGLPMRLEKFPHVEVVQVCKNGKEALAAIAEHTPDLIFLDIQMPGMTGLEVVENLQEIEDDGEVFESIEDIWPDYPTKDDFFFNEDEY